MKLRDKKQRVAKCPYRRPYVACSATNGFCLKKLNGYFQTCKIYVAVTPKEGEAND